MAKIKTKHTATSRWLVKKPAASAYCDRITPCWPTSFNPGKPDYEIPFKVQKKQKINGYFLKINKNKRGEMG